MQHTPHRPKRRRRHVLAAAAFLLVVIFLVSEFRIVVVRGDSMLPTYRSGQTVFVNRLSAIGGTWKKGDVVLVQANGDVLIKRIYKLPGETLSFFEAVPFRQVEQFFEPTGDERAPFRVPRGYVLVLGDNLAVSEDSRSFGPVPLESVLGHVMNAPPRP